MIPHSNKCRKMHPRKYDVRFTCTPPINLYLQVFLTSAQVLPVGAPGSQVINPNGIHGIHCIDGENKIWRMCFQSLPHGDIQRWFPMLCM